MCCRRFAEVSFRQSELYDMQQLHSQIMHEQDSKVKPPSSVLILYCNSYAHHCSHSGEACCCCHSCVGDIPNQCCTSYCTVPPNKKGGLAMKATPSKLMPQPAADNQVAASPCTSQAMTTVMAG